MVEENFWCRACKEMFFTDRVVVMPSNFVQECPRCQTLYRITVSYQEVAGVLDDEPTTT